MKHRMLGVVVIMMGMFALVTVQSAKAAHSYKMLIITSPSMASDISPGSLVLIRHVMPWQYNEGDVVTFIPPGSRTYVTHRITRIVYRRDVPIVMTKGDSNTNGDPWCIAVGSVRGKVVLKVPGVGSWILSLQSLEDKAGRILSKVTTNYEIIR